MEKRKYFLLPVILIIAVSCIKITEQKTEETNTLIIDTKKPLDIKENNYNNELINIEQNKNEEPHEFIGINWNNNFGSLDPIDNITLNELQSCSWQRYNNVLLFSEKGNYANMGRDRRDFGSYTLKDNMVQFSPPINIIRFTDELTIKNLKYSNEIYFEGSPVLINDDETVVFYANDSIKAETEEIIKLHHHYSGFIF